MEGEKEKKEKGSLADGPAPPRRFSAAGEAFFPLSQSIGAVPPRQPPATPRLPGLFAGKRWRLSSPAGSSLGKGGQSGHRLSAGGRLKSPMMSPFCSRSQSLSLSPSPPDGAARRSKVSPPSSAQRPPSGGGRPLLLLAPPAAREKESRPAVPVCSLEAVQTGSCVYDYSPFWKNFLASSTTFSSNWGGRGS